MTFTLDQVYDQLRMQYGPDEDIRIRHAWEAYDDGMDPVLVVIYDVMGYYDDEPTLVEAGYSRKREIVVLQGRNKLAREDIDYMEGW